MKKVLLFACLSLSVATAFGQRSNLIALFGGAGASTKYNYDVGLSGGGEFMMSLGYKTWLGAEVMYQSYNILYDKEANYVNNGGGNAGVWLLNKSAYIFVLPKLSHDIGTRGVFEAYVTAGAGFNMGGTETLHKWDYSHGTAAPDYDSTINTSKNINSMVIRVGVGLTEYLHMNKKWWIIVTEDCGFLANTVSKTSNADDPSRTSYSPNGKLNPNYFSLQIGICHTRYWKLPTYFGQD